MMEPAKVTIFTIGHSIRSFEQLIELLNTHGVDCLIDIRTVPKSRQNPQFDLATIEKELPRLEIEYRHMKSLGGLRHPKENSINTGWEDAGFRGFTDYMQTAEFSKALESLMVLAYDQQIAIMCAEANPYRCHRILVADALTVRGIEVRHITSLIAASRHRLTPFALINGDQITYPNIP